MPPPPRPQSRTIAAAMLLALSGGMLDAVVYLKHGHVFVNAMTGNVILMAIALVAGDTGQALRHVEVLGAFVVGLAAARRLRTLPVEHSIRLVLALQIVLLFIAGLLPRGLPEAAFITGLAAVSAFQVATFRRVEGFSYSSTFLTGNLRDLVDSVGERLQEVDLALRYRGSRRARDLALVCLGFALGATAGAALVRWNVPRALWVPEAPLLVVLGMMLLGGRQR